MSDAIKSVAGLSINHDSRRDENQIERNEYKFEKVDPAIENVVLLCTISNREKSPDAEKKATISYGLNDLGTARLPFSIQE